MTADILWKLIPIKIVCGVQSVLSSPEVRNHRAQYAHDPEDTLRTQQANEEGRAQCWLHFPKVPTLGLSHLSLSDLHL